MGAAKGPNGDRREWAGVTASKVVIGKGPSKVTSHVCEQKGRSRDCGKDRTS